MPRVPVNSQSNRGTWTAEEDQKLAQVIEVHGPKKWKSVAAKAGLNRCGKSCRLRWMNYLRPNIKRGNISDQEEDLILRLHKLLGNRWSLIAGRLPGRTDNEIKNYWNSHLSKKIKQNNEKQTRGPNSTIQDSSSSKIDEGVMKKEGSDREGTATVASNNADDHHHHQDSKCSNSVRDDGDRYHHHFFDCYSEEPLNLEWMGRFFEMDETWFNF